MAEETKQKRNPENTKVFTAIAIAIALIIGYASGVWSEKASNAMMLNAIFKNSDISVNVNSTKLAEEMNQTLYPMMSLFTGIMLNSVANSTAEFAGCKKMPYGEEGLYLMNCTNPSVKK